MAVKSERATMFTGDRFWCSRKGILHRAGGPAFESVDGSREWWVAGKQVRVEMPGDPVRVAR